MHSNCQSYHHHVSFVSFKFFYDPIRRTFLALGGGCVRTPRTPPAYGPADFKTKSKWLANKRSKQACRWGFRPFTCEIRLREYKSTLSDKGLNYFISVKLLILETIVSQRPWMKKAACDILSISRLFWCFSRIVLGKGF